VYLGNLLMNTATKDVCEVELYDHDPDLAQAFARAGRSSLGKEDLTAIAAHTYTVYLKTAGGTVEAARGIMAAAGAVLRAGGIAVKVESASVAHSARQWMDLASRGDREALYRAFVVLVGSRAARQFYSCGMHNLGYPDALVAGDDPDAAASLLQTFLSYLLLEDPALASGHTFSTSAKAPHYRLTLEPCTIFQPDNLFHNPFGVWHLLPLA
jgi:hypothetical protein